MGDVRVFVLAFPFALPLALPLALATFAFGSVFAERTASAEPGPVRALPASSASAQAHAGELFKTSAEAYRQGDFKRTVDLLNEAFTLDPQPVILYNLGRAYEGLGDLDLAIDAYTRYLAADPKASDRKSLEQRVATLQRQRDEKKGLEKQRDDERQRAELAAEEQKRAEQRAAQPRTRTPTSTRTRSVGPYIVGGVGLAGLAAGGIVGLMANAKHDAATTERVQQTAIEQQDQAKSLATISTVSFVVGGVLAAAGVVWWVLDTPPSRGPSTGALAPKGRVGLSPMFITFERSF